MQKVKKVKKNKMLSDQEAKRNSGHGTFYSLSTKKESDDEFANK